MRTLLGLSLVTSALIALFIPTNNEYVAKHAGTCMFVVIMMLAAGSYLLNSGLK